jgi:hypothetical protein
MALTPSEVASLARSLSLWEIAEYISAGLVTLACVGEYIADFKPWFTGGDKDKKEQLSKRSTLLLIASLSFELVCLVRTNQISGRVLGSLDDKADAASRKSEQAIINADSAITKAGDAQKSANEAADAAARASDSAKKANREAEIAKQRAEEVRKLAARANRQAEQLAEKLLAEESKRLALETDRSPRTLAYTSVNGRENIAPLKRFAGTPARIRFIPDAEVRRAAKNIIFVVQRAGWTVASLTVGEERVGWEGMLHGESANIRTGERGTEFGITVAENDGVFVGYNGMDRASECAALSLVDFLRSNNWAADEYLIPLSVSRAGIPAGTVNIFVGLQPTYIKPPDMKDLEEQTKDDSTERIKKEVERLRSERRKDCAQIFGR